MRTASSNVCTQRISSAPSAASNASSYSEGGTKNRSTPSRLAASIFWGTPPTAPMTPLGVIVPVVATVIPPVSSPSVSTSRMANEKAKPADGPRTLPTSKVTSNGAFARTGVSMRTPKNPAASTSGCAASVMVSSSCSALGRLHHHRLRRCRGSTTPRSGRRLGALEWPRQDLRRIGLPRR